MRKMILVREMSKQEREIYEILRRFIVQDGDLTECVDLVFQVIGDKCNKCTRIVPERGKDDLVHSGLAPVPQEHSGV